MKKEGKISRKKVICAASAIIIFILALIFDSQIVSFFASIQVPFIVTVMKVFSFFGSWYVIPFVAIAIILFSREKNKPKALIGAMTSLLLGIISAYIFKIIVARPRPLDLSVNFAAWDSSFPSSHAVAAFAILPCLDKRLQPYWLAFAILISLSRIYLGVHYASDVIAGVILGYVMGLVGTKIFKLDNKK